jgi:general secretion pathway protein G
LTNRHHRKKRDKQIAPQRRIQLGIKRWEIVLALAISGSIALVIGVIVNKRLGGEMEAKIENDFRRISVALHQYKLDNKRYPSTDQGLMALLQKPTSPPQVPLWKGPYINREAIILDPWKKAYFYESSDAPPGFEIRTLGADGKEGGEHVNEDRVVRFQSDEDYFEQ